MGIDFEWDPNKAARNLQKHGVPFEEAATVFRDDLSITVPDPDHSLEDERFITVGVSSQHRLVMVAHSERGDLIRIIIARALTPRGRRQYVEAARVATWRARAAGPLGEQMSPPAIMWANKRDRFECLKRSLLS